MAHQRLNNRFYVVSAFLLLASCSVTGPLREDRKADGYQLGNLSSKWRVVALNSGADKVYLNTQSKALLSVNSLCGRYEDSSLEALTKELLTPMKQHIVLSQSDLTISGRRALHTVTKGNLDGVPVESEIVVIRKNRCLFDFNIYAKKIAVAERSEFLNFVKSFEFQESR